MTYFNLRFVLLGLHRIGRTFLKWLKKHPLISGIFLSSLLAISLYLIAYLTQWLVVTLLAWFLRQLPAVLLLFVSRLAAALVTTYFLLRLLPRIVPTLRTSPEELGLSELTPRWLDVLLVIPTYAGFMIFSVLLLAIFSLLPHVNLLERQEVFLGVVNRSAPLQVILHFLMVVIIAPLSEELFMRGWLYGKLRARLSMVPAIILTSFVFAVLHFQLNVGIVTFAMSVAMCIAREITGTIWTGIILHILQNSLALFFLYQSFGG